MRKTLLYALPVTLAVGVAGAAQAQSLFPLFPEVEKVRTIQPSGETFDQRLAREYRDLALFEADEMGDWPDADFFAEKANRAAAGDVLMPTEPSKWDIGDKAAMSELETARVELVGLLEGGRDRAPTEAAVAQAKYDCWVEQQEEGHQFDHIAACRTGYLAALDELKRAMQPTTTTYETTQQEIARQSVYFDWDKANIRPDQQAEIDRFIAEMRKIEPVTLYIAGHADTSGPADYNETLSRRRADAVRAQLLEEGMTVGEYKDLKVEAKGEQDPAVPTGDGVREERNRRVEIIATGQSTQQRTVNQTPTGTTTPRATR